MRVDISQGNFRASRRRQNEKARARTLNEPGLDTCRKIPPVQTSCLGNFRGLASISETSDKAGACSHFQEASLPTRTFSGATWVPHVGTHAARHGLPALEPTQAEAATCSHFLEASLLMAGVTWASRVGTRSP
eukprot:s3479_g2.t1